MGTVTELRPPLTREVIRERSHQSIRDAGDLILALNEAAQFPGVYTDADKEILQRRLAALNKSMERLIG